jgi:hypothetical protein
VCHSTTPTAYVLQKLGKTLAKHTSRLDLNPRDQIKRFFLEEMEEG